MTATGLASRLGTLADPGQFTAPIALGQYSRERLARCLRNMLVIRAVEERIGDMVTAGRIACPCHLGIGQEAIAVGVAERLRNTDRVFGAHRSHSHFLAGGGDVTALFAEVLGKVTGCSRGMGGSMHLFDGASGFSGSVPIVAGTVPLAVGAGLAASMDGNGDLAVAYFGDGAIEEGAVHESLNLAANFRIPVLFVCENNLFASHLHISQRQVHDATSRFAVAHGIPHEMVDGNDLIAVAAAAGRLADRARAGEGPGFLEAVTYRWRGHVGPREDIDVGVNRSGDLAGWKKRDPVARLARALATDGALDDRAFGDLHAEVAREIDTAWAAAEAAPFPEPSATLDLVYAAGGSR
jgi:pyruvate dehydrogenase E1 component alpha subunit